MATSSTRAREIDIVRALAAELGLDVRPVVIAERSNLVIALEPFEIVARVAVATSTSRVGLDWIGREVEIARFLGPSLSTVPADTIDAGPHVREGLVISFWRRERLVDEPVTGEQLGACLARCHRALAAFPPHELPLFGAYQEAVAARTNAPLDRWLGRAEVERVDRVLDEGGRAFERARARSFGMQAVHGDAHIGNVLATVHGPRFTDWEDAFFGPIEYDLACLRSKADLFGEDVARIEAACAAYDVPHDPELVRELGVFRNAQVIVWLAIFAERDASLVPRLRARAERLPRTS